MRQIEWPARLQRLTRGPLADDAAAGLGTVARRRPQPGGRRRSSPTPRASWRDRPLYLIVGMLNTKDAGGFLAPLAPHAQALYARDDPRRGEPAAGRRIAATARALGIDAEETGSVEAALRAIVGRAGPTAGAPARVLICGSLHFAGVVLAENG